MGENCNRESDTKKKKTLKNKQTKTRWQVNRENSQARIDTEKLTRPSWALVPIQIVFSDILLYCPEPKSLFTFVAFLLLEKNGINHTESHTEVEGCVGNFATSL
jgi:hypothetical protein